MTAPRRIVAGVSYALTRRCLDRRFYLKPSPELDQIYLYALAHAQQKHVVKIHAFVAMSNHPHESVTDVDGILPDFMRDPRREIALPAKELYQIPESFWSPERPSAVELHGAHAQLEKILYTLLNPVRAGSSPAHRSGPAPSHSQVSARFRFAGLTCGSVATGRKSSRCESRRRPAGQAPRTSGTRGSPLSSSLARTRSATTAPRASSEACWGGGKSWRRGHSIGHETATSWCRADTRRSRRAATAR
jgi:hypothetical protein